MDRYHRIDAQTSAEHAVDIGLDVATAEGRETLLALAEGSYQRSCTAPLVLEALKHVPTKPEFVMEMRDIPITWFATISLPEIGRSEGQLRVNSGLGHDR